MSGRNSTLKISRLQIKRPGFSLHADFEIRSGQCAAVMGPSGSGKSSLLTTIVGFERDLGLEVVSGSVFLKGPSTSVDLRQLSPDKRGIGYVFQDPRLFPLLKVWENIAFGLRIRGMAKDLAREKSYTWLKRIGLEHKAEGSVDELSGGEKQRVSVARALIWEPEIILLDEPFTALDVPLRQAQRIWMKEILIEHPVPVLLVTHDPEDVAQLAVEVFEIKKSVDGPEHSFSVISEI
jgi:ABC-type sulfate/molybdate transport systems ATPase subunit